MGNGYTVDETLTMMFEVINSGLRKIQGETVYYNLVQNNKLDVSGKPIISYYIARKKDGGLPDYYSDERVQHTIGHEGTAPFSYHSNDRKVIRGFEYGLKAHSDHFSFVEGQRDNADIVVTRDLSGSDAKSYGAEGTSVFSDYKNKNDLALDISFNNPTFLASPKLAGLHELNHSIYGLEHTGRFRLSPISEQILKAMQPFSIMLDEDKTFEEEHYNAKQHFTDKMLIDFSVETVKQGGIDNVDVTDFSMTWLKDYAFAYPEFKDLMKKEFIEGQTVSVADFLDGKITSKGDPLTYSVGDKEVSKEDLFKNFTVVNDRFMELTTQPMAKLFQRLYADGSINSKDKDMLEAALQLMDLKVEFKEGTLIVKDHSRVLEKVKVNLDFDR